MSIIGGCPVHIGGCGVPVFAPINYKGRRFKMYKYHRIWFCVCVIHPLLPKGKKLSEKHPDVDVTYFDYIFNYELNDIIKEHPTWELVQVSDDFLNGKKFDGYAIFREKIENVS